MGDRSAYSNPANVINTTLKNRFANKSRSADDANVSQVLPFNIERIYHNFSRISSDRILYSLIRFSHKIKAMKFYFFVLFLFLPPMSEAKIYQYSAEARDDSGKLAYTEKHVVSMGPDDKVVSSSTEYLDALGVVISILKTDYQNSLTAPAHVLEDLRNQSRHGIRVVENNTVMFYQEKDKSEQTKIVSSQNKSEDAIVVGCQGLHYYILENLEDIRKKRRLKLDFLITGNLETYRFDLNLVKDDKESGMAEFEINIHNWFLRLFAPKLIVRYDTKLKRITYYKGLSNIPDSKGKMQNVAITYQYP